VGDDGLSKSSPTTVVPLTGWAADRFGTTRRYCCAVASKVVLLVTFRVNQVSTVPYCSHWLA
jgi:hypothetical protein